MVTTATEEQKQHDENAPGGGGSQASWLDIFARLIERFVPDAITTAILLMLVLFILSLSIGTSVSATMDAYYKGLWMLLAFTMQMTLVLVLSLILASTDSFKKIVVTLSRLPKTAFQVVALSVLCAGLISYLNWGLGIALGPVVAMRFAKEAELKGIKIDFLFLLATLAGAGSVWQFGLSASAPLLMATPGHFLESTTGIMSLRSTIWSTAAITHVGIFTVAVIAAGYFLMPKAARPISNFAESNKIAESAGTSGEAPVGTRVGTLSIVQKLERSSIVVGILCIALIGWLYYHFFVRQLSLDINSLNTVVLLLCLVLHRNIWRFTKALREAVVSSWPIVLMYHLYAGVAGLIQFTPVGEYLASLVNPISNEYSYPLLTALISTVVAIFIPTSGGQWLIQGFITVKAAEAVGLSAQRGLLALSIGDHMGNLISPFWAVVSAEIARIDFRSFFGYRLIFAAIWFVIGVTIFTFLPA